MKPLKEKVSVSLDMDVIDVIKVKAEDDDRNFSQYINKVLKDHIVLSERKEAKQIKVKK